MGGGQTDWRGKVQHVNSGEARYFRDWSTLETFLEGLISKPNPDEGHVGGVEQSNNGR